jgi:hypothetical protein
MDDLPLGKVVCPFCTVHGELKDSMGHGRLLTGRTVQAMGVRDEKNSFILPNIREPFKDGRIYYHG